MKKTILLLASSLLLANESEMLDFLNDLDTASKISTKTKLNSNKTPGIVSVLHSSELQKLGITDVYSALETVPGIEVSMGIAGAKQINMRGNKSLVTDKLKFMIDGISINSELSGSNHFYLNLPLENVQRIEIIRGPASALYGSFAHIGVVNIITKASTHKKNVLFVRSSSKGSNNLGFTQHINNKEIKIALTGSFQKNQNSREYSSYSLLPSTNVYTSYEDFTSTSLGATIEFYKDISFTSNYLELDMQNYFGYGAWPIVHDPKNLVHTSFINELHYTPKITRDLNLDMKLGYKEYIMAGLSRLHPYSIQQPKPPYPPYDLLGKGNYKEQTIYADFSALYNYANHNFIFGTYLSQTNADGTTYSVNNPAISEETNIAISGGGLQENISRQQYAFYISDLYNISEKWSANIGLRYDNYSDADSAIAPKLALLYANNEEQSYKLMYQRSFRTPSFTELYGTQAPFIGDPNLKSETIDTIELAYRYQKSFDSWFGINFFYSDMRDFIYRDSAFNLKNGEDSISYGSEIEFKTPLFAVSTLQANYSYIHMEDKSHNKAPMIANHLANVMFIYPISNNWNTGTKLRYVGERAREIGDTRECVPAYTTFDQTVSYNYKNLLLQVSVKNLFDTAVIYPAPIGNGTSSGTYENDLPRDGRTFWISAQWKIK